MTLNITLKSDPFLPNSTFYWSPEVLGVLKVKFLVSGIRISHLSQESGGGEVIQSNLLSMLYELKGQHCRGSNTFRDLLSVHSEHQAI